VLDILAARRRLSPHLQPTPLLHSSWLSEAAGGSVFLKVESLQPARSFKIRGAMNALLRSDGAGNRSQTIVTASAGNHGRAIALAAERLGRRAVVFVPATAPETKKAAIRQHGAELHDDPVDYDAAELAAREYAAREGGQYVSPYNDADVIAGAGTIAFELLEAQPAVDVVILPLGGGGLASGVGIALKSIAPRVTTVGVEVEASTPFATGIAQGAITRIDVGPSLADGLTGNLEPASMTFDLVGRHVDRLISIGEGELAAAMRGLASEEHLIAEGAGATTTAALLTSRVTAPGQRTVVLLTGGNIDLALFSTIVS
jgi:threonine dehydratase